MVHRTRQPIRRFPAFIDANTDPPISEHPGRYCPRTSCFPSNHYDQHCPMKILWYPPTAPVLGYGSRFQHWTMTLHCGSQARHGGEDLLAARAVYASRALLLPDCAGPGISDRSPSASALRSTFHGVLEVRELLIQQSAQGVLHLSLAGRL